MKNDYSRSTKGCLRFSANVFLSIFFPVEIGELIVVEIYLVMTV